jgi:DNA-binding MarR family transcriptional regulator
MIRKGQPMSRKTLPPDPDLSRDDLSVSGLYAPSASGAVTKEEFEAIAEFRYAIRRFLRFSETAARREHVTPQQHQLLLAIKGFPDREYARVSELADRLQMRQHSMVGLIDRSEAQGFVRREPSTTDRRQVYVHLTPAGEGVLYRLAIQHHRELRTMREALRLP